MKGQFIKMINAVICEFNPFHNGHKYLLEQAVKKTGANATVCFMSGNFVQRGEPAITDKHTRAAAALEQGADLVFQIPTAHTLAGASVFAGAGVFLASAMGVPTTLCFGTESEDLTPLYTLALVDRKKLASAFTSHIKSGKSYAAAVTAAYADCGAGDAEALKSPNNLLAFEYIKAIIDQKSDLKIQNIVRVGAEHDGQTTEGGFASASFIRQNPETASQFAPVILPTRLDRATFDNLARFSIYTKTPFELSQFADMSEGLENRFCDAAKTAVSLDSLIDAVKSKRYTRSRLCRAAVNVLIGNPKGLYKRNPPCLRVLGFNDRGRELLKELSNTATLPIITKPADMENLPDARAHFELECRASDIYDYCCFNKKGGGVEYRMSPVYKK